MPSYRLYMGPLSREALMEPRPVELLVADLLRRSAALRGALTEPFVSRDIDSGVFAKLDAVSSCPLSTSVLGSSVSSGSWMAARCTTS